MNKMNVKGIQIITSLKIIFVSAVLLMQTFTSATLAERQRIDEAAALGKMESWLEEVISLSPEEIQSGEISAIYLTEYDVWEVFFKIADKYLTVKNSLMLHQYYDRTSRIVTIAIYVPGNPDAPTNWTTLDDYELLQLLPENAYISQDTSKGRIDRFIEMTIEEKAAFSKAWKPVVDDWLEAHQELKDDESIKYNANYICTRRIFGVPDRQSIHMEKAEQLAVSYVADTSGFSQPDIREKCEMYHFYDVTDTSMPLWLVLVDSQGYFKDNLVTYGYLVVIDPYEGQAVRSHIIYNSIDRVMELYINKL